MVLQKNSASLISGSVSLELNTTLYQYQMSSHDHRACFSSLECRLIEVFLGLEIVGAMYL